MSAHTATAVYAQCQTVLPPVGWQSSLCRALPPQWSLPVLYHFHPVLPSCSLSPTHPQLWTQGQACCCLPCAVEVRSGFVFPLCFLSTALINVCCPCDRSLSSTGRVHSVTQFWRGMLFQPVLLGRPEVLSINSLRLLHHEQ